jgi:hypothetical protein
MSFTETEIDARAGTMFIEALRRTHLGAPEEFAQIFAEAARSIGVTALVIYLVDYEQRTLAPVPSRDAASAQPLSIGGTVAGRAFATTSILNVEADGGQGRRLWVPLLDGTERIGVMSASFATQEPLPEELVAVCERYAHLMAVTVVSKSAYTDHFELLRRSRPMTLASELVWGLVPPLVLASEDFVLSALLEPCYDIGGDTFDYSLNRRVLHLAVFDAMGHGLAAAGVAALALSAYRHSRRQGHSPAASYASIDAALCLQQGQVRPFVTALIAELDLASGQLRWVSAGHPPPLLVRGGRMVKTLDVVPAPPLGLQLAALPPAEGRESLQPGDMVLLYTDGLTEARRPGGGLFTVERLGEFIEREAASGHAAPETLRRLREAIIERHEGDLRDDATAVLLEWRCGNQGKVVPETV